MAPALRLGSQIADALDSTYVLLRPVSRAPASMLDDSSTDHSSLCVWGPRSNWATRRRSTCNIKRLATLATLHRSTAPPASTSPTTDLPVVFRKLGNNGVFQSADLLYRDSLWDSGCCGDTWVLWDACG